MTLSAKSQERLRRQRWGREMRLHLEELATLLSVPGAQEKAREIETLAGAFRELGKDIQRHRLLDGEFFVLRAEVVTTAPGTGKYRLHAEPSARYLELMSALRAVVDGISTGHGAALQDGSGCGNCEPITVGRPAFMRQESVCA